ncbi:MAG: amino acid-binding protein [Planctomycetota bacterium]|nr:amino acid-binding protein [Planctomycetota bacterium]
MAWKVTRIKIWAASIEDKPGALAGKLTTLAKAGASLEFAFARRAPEKPGTGVVFVTPLQGAGQLRAARAAGFQTISRVHGVRVEAPNMKGVGACLTHRLAAAELNLRGFSAVGRGKQAVVYLAFDSEADAAAAVRALKKPR